MQVSCAPQNRPTTGDGEGNLKKIQHKKIWSQPGLRAPTWTLCEGGFWNSSSKPKKRPSELLFVLLQPCFAQTCSMGRPISYSGASRKILLQTCARLLSGRENPC